MALKATIFKAELSIADMDRHYFDTHRITIARHPSETDERMMLRILAFALCAGPDLAFTKGLCVTDEPEIWKIAPDGSIAHWIELGLPSEKRIRQACNKSDKVSLFCYGGRTVAPWWQKMEPYVRRFDNLEIFEISEKDSNALAKWSERTMRLHFTIQDGEANISNESETLSIKPSTLFELVKK